MKLSCFSTFALVATLFATVQVTAIQESPFPDDKPAAESAAVKKMKVETVKQSPPESKKVASQDATKPAQEKDLKIRFSFNNQDWKDVIPWFAKQANLSLQPISDYPEGVFNLKDDSEYSVMEALDELNHALRLRQPESYTLVRKRNMLVLSKLRADEFPDDLVETVQVEDLNSRGLFEIMECQFDVGELDAERIGDELRSLVGDMHRDHYFVFPTSNQIAARGTGSQLRKMRDMIKTAHTKEFGDEKTMKVYMLKNQDSETFMSVAGGMLGIEPGSNMRPDETLMISIEPFGERLFVRATAKQMAEFEKVAAIVDTLPGELSEEVKLDPLFLHTYPVTTDPAVAFAALQTMLEGRDDIKMDQDSNTGAVTFLGRKADHQMVIDTLAALVGDAGAGFDIIQLENADPAEVISVVMSALRLTLDSESGPVIMGNSASNQIMISGTPQEVAMVKNIVAKVELNSVAPAPAMRSTTRILSMTEREAEEVAPLLQSFLLQSNRTNPLNVILPEDRKDLKKSLQNQNQEGSYDPLQELLEGSRSATPDQSRLQPRRRYVPNRRKTSQLNSVFNQGLLVASTSMGINPFLLSGLIAPQEEEVGQTSDESTGSQTRPKSSDYMPAPAPKTVPGAPIKAEFRNNSLILQSEDLDALDDLIWEIENRVGSTSVVELPTFFYLDHRPADQMMAFLERYFGMESSSGGAGGASNLMSGMMSNMMGGGGDLLGDLLGGGTGGSGGGGTLEGDVRLGIDMKFNLVYVAGATTNDLDQMNYVIDLLDRPSAPHDPELVGQFRTIDIIHADPQSILENVTKMLGDAVESEQQGGQGGGQEAAAMAKAIQQLTQGGKRGGGADTAAEEKPKVRLGVDLDTSQLLVIGPEYLYNSIVNIVNHLDKPELSTPRQLKTIANIKNPDKVLMALQEVYGAGKIQVVGQEGSTPDDGRPGGSGQGTNTAQGSASKQSSDAARSAFFNAIRQQQSAAAKGGQAQRGGQPQRGGNGRGGRGGR